MILLDLFGLLTIAALPLAKKQVESIDSESFLMKNLFR